MTKTLGKPRFTHSPHEVIEFRDDEHTPYNKRSGECDSDLAVEFRAPLGADWVNFCVEETTTTRAYGDNPGRTQSRTISFNLTRAQFAAVVAHVNRKKD